MASHAFNFPSVRACNSVFACINFTIPAILSSTLDENTYQLGAPFPSAMAPDCRNTIGLPSRWEPSSQQSCSHARNRRPLSPFQNSCYSRPSLPRKGRIAPSELQLEHRYIGEFCQSFTKDCFRFGKRADKLSFDLGPRSSLANTEIQNELWRVFVVRG